MSRNQKIGKWGEQFAAKYLLDKGLTILDQNVRTEYGEIDLIARQGSEIIFVEVKTRLSVEYGFPEESVNERKQLHLLNAAQDYMQNHTDLGENWRIDVVSVRVDPKKSTPEVEWFENAVI